MADQVLQTGTIKNAQPANWGKGKCDEPWTDPSENWVRTEEWVRTEPFV